MKFFLLIIILYTPTYALVFDSCDENLTKSLIELDFHEDNVVVAKKFEKIYSSHRFSYNFKSCLIKFIKTDCTKNYWIGIFLFEMDYTNIRNYSLAERIMKIGIDKCKSACYEVAFNAMTGVLFLKQNKPDQAKKYFVEAGKKNKKLSGCWPAITKEEYDFVEKEFGVKP